MVLFLFGETGGKREMAEEISPQKSAVWGLTCLLEEAAVSLLPELSTERCDYHQTHQQPHHSGPRGGLFPKTITQYYAMSS